MQKTITFPVTSVVAVCNVLDALEQRQLSMDLLGCAIKLMRDYWLEFEQYNIQIQFLGAKEIYVVSIVPANTKL